ncbi:CRISPR-associated endonuclease Cas2 [bacterium]|nr:MAG: CRISPR-associated endonuclease Cas2 [bacterium]
MISENTKSFVVIAYDITDDKRRRKLAKFLEGYGDRVQYSVFEARLNKRQLMYVAGKIKRLIDEEEDSVRIYVLCNSCVEKIKVIGLGEIFELDFVYII